MSDSEKQYSDVVERMLRYAKVGSPSDPVHDDVVPSTPCQHDMAALLAAELKELGVADAKADEHAYVTGHVEASAGAEGLPCLGLIAHIDTSPDAPAMDVHPRVALYEGGEFVLGEVNGEAVTLNEKNTPGLSKLAGKELVVTDGSTLLGADDKAGVAEIMALIARIHADPSIAHPRLAICFCPDEEIGHGCSLLDLDAWGATWGYTIDGGPLGDVQYECFNAAEAVVTFKGHEIHPGSAKDIMINALHLFEEFDQNMPAWARPEHTDMYDGFIHLHGVSGTVTHATARYIIRDHDAKKFAAKKQLMLDTAEYLNKRFDEPRVEVAISDTYANMAEAVKPHMHLITNADAAFEACGYAHATLPIRGGTDGAQLSFRGLPCPDLSTGAYNCHSVREFVPVESLEAMVDVLQALVGLYAKPVAE